MGITLRDIHEQREMLRRGEEIAQAAEQAATREAERIRLRDQFAAAALTGLLASDQYDRLVDAGDYADAAYQMADAMLAAKEAKL